METINQMAVQAIRVGRSELVRAAVERLYRAQEADWTTRFANTQEKSARDVGFFLDYLSEAVAHASPSLFNDFTSWAWVLFDGLKFPPDTVTCTLSALEAVLGEQLPATQAVLLAPYFASAQAALRAGPQPPPVFVHPGLPLGGLAKDYLDALLRGDRKTASLLVMDAAARGVSVQDLYLHVFQRAQYEVGRLWQTNQINVAQEHFCTFVTELIMSLLSPLYQNRQRAGRTVVVTSIGGEQHDLGARMVADFFEMEGWDAYFLGANTPSDSILQMLLAHSAHLLAISVTLTPHVSEAANLIAQVRADPATRHAKILVGGHPFNISPGLWQTIGADGCGRDAQEAITLATQLVDGGGERSA